MVYGGAGPVGGSGSASTIKQVKLERESELRIEVFTWYGATIEMDGATETDYTADVVSQCNRPIACILSVKLIGKTKKTWDITDEEIETF
ncbi:hypothetical protein JHK85_024789 [Glycine max]|nr:hypothetical protein JHK85_024789 [Glycine max]